MKKKVVILLIFLLSAYHVFAKEMSTNYDFNGVFLGLGTGVINIWTKDYYSTSRSDASNRAAGTNRYTDTAVLFTGNVGLGTMVKRSIYVGAKGSVYYTPLETVQETNFTIPTDPSITFADNSITTQIKPIYNVDAVLGYEISPHFLPFIEAGVSFANINRSYIFKRTQTNLETNNSAQYSSYINLDNYKTGYNVGIGFNYQVKQHWIFATELVYNDLGNNSSAATVVIPGTSITETQSRNMINYSAAMFASVSYLFG